MRERGETLFIYCFRHHIYWTKNKKSNARPKLIIQFLTKQKNKVSSLFALIAFGNCRENNWHSHNTILFCFSGQVTCWKIDSMLYISNFVYTILSLTGYIDDKKNPFEMYAYSINSPDHTVLLFIVVNLLYYSTMHSSN